MIGTMVTLLVAAVSSFVPRMSLPTNKYREKGGNNTLKIIVGSASLAVNGKAYTKLDR